MAKQSASGDRVSGLCVLGVFVTGVASLLVAVIASLDREFTGAGLALLAAAMAFGLLANALFRA